MKKILSRLISIAVVICMICVCFTGCSSNPKSRAIYLPYYNEDAFSSNYFDSGVVCENEYWQLIWDNSNKLVSFKDKQTGNVWGQIPEKALNSDMTLTNSLRSAVYVYYKEASTLAEKYAYSYEGAVQSGNVWVNEIENGISVTYDFYDNSFSVTVDYVLNGDAFSTIVDPRKMSDDGVNYITGVSVLPFICGVENDHPTDWMFMPDGSGAVIKPTTIGSMGVEGKMKVYGDDLSVHQYYYEAVTQQVKMPVFGSIRETGGLVAIISSGAEQSSICWNMGSSSVGFSSVYPFYRLRGYSLEKTPNGFGWTALNYIQYFDESVVESAFQVDYRALKSEDANLTGMAEVYREHLEKTHGLIKSSVNETTANYKFVGATDQPDFFLGIPTTKLFPLTTTKQVIEITDEINKSIGSDFSVNLVGFGKSGIDEGIVGGGFTVASKLGGFGGYKKLVNHLEKLGVNSYFDFDIISFAKSGAGFTKGSDSAKAPNKLSLTFGQLNTISHAAYADGYHILARNELSKAANKGVEKLSKVENAGISFNSLASTIYSDYSYNKYRNVKNMAVDVKEIMATAKNKKLTISSASANDYAASVSDILTDCPLTSSKFDFQTYSVPFYQMVFKGYKPMSSISLNITADSKDSLLSCIESGTTPSYTIIANYENELRNSNHTFIWGSVYENQKEAFVNDVKATSKYFNSIKGAEISKYTIVNEYVKITEFDNGAWAVVNYGDTDYESEFGVVKAQSFITGA